MESNNGDKENVALPEVRLMLIGGRWAGKSSSGNTILRTERFECGRIRTAQAEVRHGEVDGRRLTVVDAPGWISSLSLAEIPEVDKQRFKLSASKCPPGPNVILLIIPIDSAFSKKQRITVEEHMKLLGETAWRYTMVLFTCGDFLEGKTIEQHIESEGDALKWLVEKCKNRYHVINNKDKSNSAQVTLLLQKIDEFMWRNNSGYYEVDEQTLRIIEEKQREVAKRAEIRQKKAEEQRQQMKKLFSEEKKPIPKLQLILLGSRSFGKTSVGNTILAIKQQKDSKRMTQSVARTGYVGKTEVTVVDTPGWWKGFTVVDTPEAIKEELMLSMFLCPPGPHVFLLVIDADESFSVKHFDAVKTHLELLGEDVWKHTIVVFTRGDWLGTYKVEEYIEGEGEALQAVVDQCGNRYHVMDSKNADDGSQVTELLEKIFETVAGNGWSHFAPDEQIRLTIEERRKKVEEAAKLRQSQADTKGKSFNDSRYKLPELRLFMLGEKTVGKSTSGNILLHKEVFATCQNKCCQAEQATVVDRLVTVVDTPGWWMDPSHCTEELDKEIVQGLTLCPLGVHAILLVVPLDLTFRDGQKVATEDHMNLLDSTVWNHTLVLFTYGDNLADKSIEEHIEREHHALRWLVEKCENRYHVLNNMKKNDLRQITELYEKIEDMVAGNNGQLFFPDMNKIHQRIHEKFRRNKAKFVLIQQLNHEYRRRELELMMGFKQTLIGLQSEVRRRSTGSKHKAWFGHSKNDGEEREDSIDMKFNQEFEKLDKDILLSTDHLRSSKELLFPEFKGDGPAPSMLGSPSDKGKLFSNYNEVLAWLSTLQFDTNVDNQLTFNSQTSGYKSAAEDTFSLTPEEQMVDNE